MLNSHASWLGRLVDYLIIRKSSNATVDGLWIGAFVDGDAAAERVLAQVRAALGLIKAYDSYRYRRVLTQFDKILVHTSASRGQFVPQLRRCVLGKEFVMDAEAAEIAATMVHEAAHGELIARGIGYEPSIRQRVEAICTRQEVIFAAKLPKPHAALLLERAQMKLDLPAETWSDESAYVRQIEWLRDGGWPDWLLSTIEGMRRWKSQMGKQPRKSKRTG